jgi:hypothetical protein
MVDCSVSKNGAVINAAFFRDKFSWAPTSAIIRLSWHVSRNRYDQVHPSSQITDEFMSLIKG